MKRTARIATMFGQLVNEFQAARSISNALEGGRKPSREALRTLGLNEDTFSSHYR